MRRPGGIHSIVLAVGSYLVGVWVLPLLTPQAFAQRGSAQMRERRRAFMERFVGNPAPPFALKNLEGKTVKLADLRGEVVVLNFWFTSCPPCRKETPDLVRLYEIRKDRGLVVIGINLDAIFAPQSGRAQMEQFLSTYKVTYPILIGTREMFDTYGSVPVQPTSFLIDREGVVDQVLWGAYSGAMFDRAVGPLLERRPQPQKPASSTVARP
jgi:peroxiredoxin